MSRAFSNQPLQSPKARLQPSTGPQDHGFSMIHLEFLHFFESRVSETMHTALFMPQSLPSFLISEAFTAPYLMDQILAISALQLSLERPERSALYFREAMALHTRALAVFNPAGKGQGGFLKTGEQKFDDFSAILFSALVSHYQLVKTLATKSSLPEFARNFASYLRLDHGVWVLANMHWPTIQERIEPQYEMDFVKLFSPHNDPDPPAGTEFTNLYNMLDAPIPPSSRATYRRCIDMLCWIDGFRHASPCQRGLAVRGWSALIPSVYAELLEQCLPEAVIILAYYMVLCHDVSNLWIPVQTLRWVVDSIEGFLGPEWDPWLAYPRMVVDSGRFEGGSRG
ncbi:hypothetical protein BJX65DRAFT_312807 [Aspergillus insuetus]